MNTQKLLKIQAGIRNNIRSEVDKPQSGQGSRIILNLQKFLQTSGRSWGEPQKYSQATITAEFLVRLRTFLKTTQVRYESDQKLFILINGKWFELLRTDWTVTLLPLLRKIQAPAQYLNAEIIKNLYPKIIQVFKDLDPDYKEVNKLLE